MRVLRLVPYVYLSEKKIFQRNNTGFGRSVWDISRYSAQLDEEVMLLTYVPTGTFSLSNVTFAGIGPVDLIRHMHVSEPINALRVIRSYARNSGALFNKFKYLLKQSAEGYIEHLIKKHRFDIVHVHGATLDTVPFLDAAMASGVPVIVTLHGLYSVGVPSVPWHDAVVERRLVEFLNRQGICITTVSSGIRDVVIDTFEICNPDRIEVVLNGVDCGRFRTLEQKPVLRQRYGLSPDKTVFLTVGALSRVKNQRLVFDALLLVPEEVRARLQYVVVGDGAEGRHLRELASRNELDCVKFLGYRDGESLIDLYSLSDVFVFTSPAVGYPRMFLEAFCAGIPVLAFADLPGLADIYANDCMSLINGRTAGAVADAIAGAIDRRWDRETIRAHGERYSWARIAADYRTLYEDEICRWKSDNRSNRERLSGRRAIVSQYLIQHGRLPSNQRGTGGS